MLLGRAADSNLVHRGDEATAAAPHTTLSRSLQKDPVPGLLHTNVRAFRGSFALPVTTESSQQMLLRTQKHIILYLQPRSFLKTKQQWLDLTLSFFPVPGLSGCTVGVQCFWPPRRCGVQGGKSGRLATLL